MKRKPSKTKSSTSTSTSTTALNLIKKKPKKKAISDADPNKPKKPPTAFFYFLEDFRKTFNQENPDVKSMREIGKACGEKWKTMSFDEKVAYYDIATQKRADFDEAMAAYIRKRESSEISDKSDYDYDGD